MLSSGAKPGALPALNLVNVGGVDFVRLAGGPAKISDPEFADNPVREVDIKPGLLFGRDPITNLQLDEYIRGMGDQTHALVLENKRTRQMHIVARGNAQGVFREVPVAGHPELDISASIFTKKYIPVVPAADRLISLSAYFADGLISELAAPDRPAVCVSFFDALGYLDYKSRQTGRYWRLPTEEEWEAAALAGRDPEITKYGTKSGEEAKLAEEAHFNASATAPVDRFPGNPWGIRGMAGNVWQWADNVFRPGQTLRVVRGSPWHRSQLEFLRTDYRTGINPRLRENIYVGFRAVVEP